MWWFNPRRTARLAAILALAGLTAGCFQPLYGTQGSAGGPDIADKLSSVEVSPINVPNGTTFNLDISGMTQLGMEYTELDVEANGNAPSGIESIEIDSDGTMYAQYENGSFRELYRIPLANVPSPDMLTSLPGNVFSPSADSGDLQMGFPGSGGLGAMISGALENSNVDIAEELTNMIESQRSYTANSKVFQAADNREELTGMGTTVVATLVNGKLLTIASAGDSRCYLVRNGELRQLTRDDSWVSAALGEGILNSDDVEHHPLRVDQRELALALPQRGGLALDDVDDERIGKAAKHASILDPAEAKQAVTDRADVDQCLRRLVGAGRIGCAAKLVGDDLVDGAAIHVAEPDNLVAADGEAGVAHRRRRRTLGLRGNVEGHQDDERDREHERAEDEAGDLVGARLVHRQLLRDFLRHRDARALARLAACRWTAADVGGSRHCRASAISRSTSSP